jgi:hypothetical protein
MSNEPEDEEEDVPELLEVILRKLANDTDSMNDQFLEYYELSDTEKKRVINRVLVLLHGWSLPTLIKMARDPDYKNGSERDTSSDGLPDPTV